MWIHQQVLAFLIAELNEHFREIKKHAKIRLVTYEVMLQISSLVTWSRQASAMFWVYWPVHFTHLALFQVFRAKQGTTVGGGVAFCEKQETNAERETRGRESKSFIFIFSLLLSRVLHLSPSSSEMYPSLRLHYNKSACHEDCMHLNKKE